MAGLIPVGDGTYRRVEFRGPPDVGVWTVHFVVYKNTLIMSKAVGLNPLDRYIKLIHKYAREYGTRVWHLLYQAEHRFRLEELPDIRRRLASEAEAVKKGGGTHPYDPERPWHLAWQMATGEKCEKFWKDEFEKPATAVRLELARLGEFVDGDAPIDSVTSGAAAGSTYVPAATTTATPPVPKRPAATNDGDWSWPHRTNKRRRSLCKGWQTGCCPSGPNGSVICPVDDAARHQCAICLGDHPGGASQCNGSGSSSQGAGRGRGAGKNKGKNGGGKGAGGGKNKGKAGGKGAGRGQQQYNQWQDASYNNWNYW